MTKPIERLRTAAKKESYMRTQIQLTIPDGKWTYGERTERGVRTDIYGAHFKKTILKRLGDAIRTSTKRGAIVLAFNIEEPIETTQLARTRMLSKLATTGIIPVVEGLLLAPSVNFIKGDMVQGSFESTMLDSES